MKHRVSLVMITVALISGIMAAPMSAQAAPSRHTENFQVLNMSITSVVVDNGQLWALGNFGSAATQFRAPITVTQQPGSGACPILSLEINEIHLNLLGLRVDTSDICVTITAYEDGGLLGDLLCAIANLLEDGLTLDTILAGLDTSQLNTLTSGLTNLLNQAVGNLTLFSNRAGISATCTILDLELGRIELNLLGLEVVVDNCAGGPVEILVSADPTGGLLGQLLSGLLCDLADLLRVPSNITAIITTLKQIADLIASA